MLLFSSVKEDRVFISSISEEINLNSNYLAISKTGIKKLVLNFRRGIRIKNLIIDGKSIIGDAYMNHNDIPFINVSSTDCYLLKIDCKNSISLDIASNDSSSVRARVSVFK